MTIIDLVVTHLVARPIVIESNTSPNDQVTTQRKLPTTSTRTTSLPTVSYRNVGSKGLLEDQTLKINYLSFSGNEWTACSKSCGLGEKFRNRTIIKAPKKAGVPCPQLTERSWCGSSRCKPNLNNENIDNSTYFKW